MGFLNNITVKSRISALFALSIILFVLFGIFALQRIGTMADLTKAMYEHPLQVSNAALRAQTGVIRMHRAMKDMILSQSQIETAMAMQALIDDEDEVHKELALVKELILGDEGKKLAQETIVVFDGWRPVRKQVEEFVLKGDKAAAFEVHRRNTNDYVAGLSLQMKGLNAYARKKADGFMAHAEETRQQTLTMVIVAFCLVATLCFVSAFLLISSITRSLGYLKDKMASSTSSGEMGMVEVDGKNEIAD